MSIKCLKKNIMNGKKHITFINPYNIVYIIY